MEPKLDNSNNPPLPNQNCPLPTPRTLKNALQSEDAIKRKEIRELDTKYHSLDKAYQKLEEKYNDCYSKMKSHRKKAETLEKELGNSRMVNTKLTEEKEDLQKQLNKNKEYIRKLEASITLKKPMPAATTDHIVSKEKGDGVFTENLMLKKELNEERVKNEELVIIKESNNEELLRLEALVNNLTIEKEAFQKSCQELAQERGELLDFIEELNGKIEDLTTGYEGDMKEMRSEFENYVILLLIR